MNSPALQNSLAQLAAQDFAGAAAGFSRILETEPDNIEALIGHGQSAFALGQVEDARDSFELALAHAPGSAPARLGLSRLLRASGDSAGALTVLREALQCANADAAVHFELGLALNSLDDPAGAAGAYERALELSPRHLGALVNLGLICLTQRVDYARAQQLFDAARTWYPEEVAAQANFGLALQEQGRFAQALSHYDSLIARQPQVIEYRWNRAVACLHLGDFAHGWTDYELRHVRGGHDVRRDFGLPAWEGDNPSAYHFLVYAEQGIGDEIMFASCLADLARNAASVVLECDSRLQALFARSFPQIAVHGRAPPDDRRWLAAYPHLDRQVAIGSLPRFFRREIEHFPRHHGYLVPSGDRLHWWRGRLATEQGGPLIGLSWRGGTRKTRAGLRSMEMRDLLPLAGIPNLRFVCLQRGDCGADVEAARKAGMNIFWWPEALQDPDECAALIAALDTVVSVDNTVVHLAGALGKPCWVPLAAVPDWRYGLEGGTMPWYPSLRLFRRLRDGGWAPVIADLAAALASLATR